MVNLNKCKFIRGYAFSEKRFNPISQDFDLVNVNNIYIYIYISYNLL